MFQYKFCFHNFNSQTSNLSTAGTVYDVMVTTMYEI
jgi:hypothetical protein